MRKNSTRAARLLDSGGLWELSLKLLGARACTMGELRAKLRLKAAAAQDVETTIARLKSCGYLDDRRLRKASRRLALKIKASGNAESSRTYGSIASRPRWQKPLSKRRTKPWTKSA